MKRCWNEAYFEKKFAKKIMRKMNKLFWKKRTVYKCENCWFYHITSCTNGSLVHFRNKKNNYAWKKM